MSTQLSRKDLKQDAFAATVQGGVVSFSSHKKEIVRYGGIALAVIIIAAGVWYYRMAQASVREQTLGDAMTVFTATVASNTPQPGVPNFSTQPEKDAAVVKAFTKVTQDFSGSEEAYIAEYYLASKSADAGKTDDARRQYQDVIAHANSSYASLAKYALAQVDLASGHDADGLNLLKDLMDHPSDLVTKNQATITYAQAVAAKQPEEARKLLEPISKQPTADGQAQASAALAQIAQK